jgi:hypothetical protein
MSGLEREPAFPVRQCVADEPKQRVASERLGIGKRQVPPVAGGQRRGPGLTPARPALAPAHEVRAKYADFGATLASEKLLEADGITVSAEKVRPCRSALASGGRGRGVRSVFQLRQRRPRFGESIQIDGSSARLIRGLRTALRADE